MQGVSGVVPIQGFNTEDFSTRFAGEIQGFACNGYVAKKMERRLDSTIKYIMVSGKKASTSLCSQPGTCSCAYNKPQHMMAAHMHSRQPPCLCQHAEPSPSRNQVRAGLLRAEDKSSCKSPLQQLAAAVPDPAQGASVAAEGMCTGRRFSRPASPGKEMPSQILTPAAAACSWAQPWGACTPSPPLWRT